MTNLDALYRVASKVREARKRERAATDRYAREKAQQDVHAHEARFFDDWTLLHPEVR